MINWSKLKPYNNDSKKSFEELCYQIAKVLYSNRGSFTSVDDSGGGDGVEFYLTLSDRKQWGWQAKFYYPDLRLSVSNRKSSIIGSLKKACKEHPNLERWFLCTPTNLTTTEKKWFDETLPRSIQDDFDIELFHWSDSDFSSWLSEPRFSGKRNYFFGELELDLNWFRRQHEKQIASIRNKFNPILHTESNVDAIIHQILGDHRLINLLTEKITDCKKQFKEYQEAVSKFKNYNNCQFDWEQQQIKLVAINVSLAETLSNAISQIEKTINFLDQRLLEQAQGLNWDLLQAKIKQERKKCLELLNKLDFTLLDYKGKDENKDDNLKEAKSKVSKPIQLASNLEYDLKEIFDQIKSVRQSDLQIFGDAGIGKTHLACNIVNERLDEGLPALLISGNRFNSDRSLEEQLRGILDIPPNYSWHNFLQALESVAETYGTRIPIVIDSLNEAIYNGIFSQVWELYLPGLTQEIQKTKNIVLITTCRTTYKEAIWDENEPSNI